MTDKIAVTVGKGRKIHIGEKQNGGYRHLCGSGKSSFAHSFRKPKVQPAYRKTLADVTCEKCLEIFRKE